MKRVVIVLNLDEESGDFEIVSTEGLKREPVVRLTESGFIAEIAQHDPAKSQNEWELNLELVER